MPTISQERVRVIFDVFSMSHIGWAYYFPSYEMLEQNGMTFDPDFGYSFPLFSSILQKEWRRKGEWISDIVIKSHAFLLDHIKYGWNDPELIRVIIQITVYMCTNSLFPRIIALTFAALSYGSLIIALDYHK